MLTETTLYGPAAARAPSPATLVQRARAWMAERKRKKLMRASLERLLIADDHSLTDIGLTRYDIGRLLERTHLI